VIKCILTYQIHTALLKLSHSHLTIALVKMDHVLALILSAQIHHAQEAQIPTDVQIGPASMNHRAKLHYNKIRQ